MPEKSPTQQGNGTLFPQPATAGPHRDLQPVAAAVANPLTEVRLVNSEVPPASLLPQNPDTRDRATPGYLAWEQQLAEDLGQRGMKNPIHVLRTPAGPRVLMGETRRRASLIAALKLVPVVIHEQAMTQGEIALEQLLDDEMRCALTDMERIEKYVLLMELNGWTQEQLAQSVGKTQSYVCKQLGAITGFPEDMRPKIGKGQGKIPVTAAAAIARLGDPAAIREVAEVAIKRGLKRDAIIALVAQRMGKKPKKDKSLKLTCNGGTVVIKGDPVAWLKWMVARGGEAVKRIERGDIPHEAVPAMLGSMLK